MFRSLITEGGSGSASIRHVVSSGNSVDKRQRVVFVEAGGGDVVGALGPSVQRDFSRGNQLEVVVVVAAPGGVGRRPPDLAAGTVHLDGQGLPVAVVVVMVAAASLMSDEIV
jgi:hypothetical protein